MRDRKAKMLDHQTQQTVGKDIFNDDPFIYTDPFHGNNFLRKLYELYLKEELCDVTIFVDGNVIRSHKTVLAANSTYFERMFASNLKESQTDEIKIQYIQYEILKSLIDFCYTASVKVQSENALDLLSAADMLQFEGIKQCCCAFLQTKLDIQNCLSLATFADIHTCQTLKETAEEYSRKHFRAVMTNDEFRDISFEQLKQLLSNDSLAVVSEKDVFDAAVAWISYDEKERKKHFYDLLTEVRLGNLTPKLIVDCIENHPLIQSDTRSLKLLNDAKTYQLLPTHHGDIEINTKPRLLKADSAIYLVGGETRSQVFDTLDCYTFTDGKWKTKTPMAIARDGLGVASYDGRIYAAGGYDGQGALSSCECYNPESDTWVNICSMYQPRHAFSMVEFQGWLYAAGGSDFHNTEYNTVERYDPVRDCWQQIESMSSKREGLALIPNDGLLYAVGGENGVSILNTVERFDPRTGRWYNCASMGYRRRYFGAAVLNDKIYSVGGSDYDEDLNTVELFEARANRWVPIPSMRKRRESVAVVSIEQHLFAIGGACVNKETDTVEAYDPILNRWEDFAAIPRAKEGMGAIAI